LPKRSRLVASAGARGLTPFLACLAGAFAALLTISAQARDQRRSNLGAKDVAETQTAERKGAASANDFGAELAAMAVYGSRARELINGAIADFR
jgi:uncharacterized protein (UPF0261 family)